MKGYVRGGFACTLSPESVATMVRGISYLREVRDLDGMPIVVRVSLNEQGMRIEAWGVREGRDEYWRAKQWEKANGRGGSARTTRRIALGPSCGSWEWFEESSSMIVWADRCVVVKQDFT